eukprot:s3102_g3.t1
MKVRLRQSNAMALKSLKALEEAPQSHLYESLEHPGNSWLWEFTLAKKLKDLGYFSSTGSHCCFGGAREKWFEFRNNIPGVHRNICRDCPGHDNLRPYRVTRDEDGHLVYDTAEEELYPWALCRAYAKGLKEQLLEDGHFGRIYFTRRAQWYAHELEQSTQRLADPAINQAASEELARWEGTMLPGEEKAHLHKLLAMASYRGTDIRAYVTLDDEDTGRQEIPYPALRWRWRTLMSFPWDREAHINELELATVVALVKHRARSSTCFHRRWMLIIDSMVTRGALAKGRSPSRRLNRLLRRTSAVQLASDSYAFPLWTISRWNFSDGATSEMLSLTFQHLVIHRDQRSVSMESSVEYVGAGKGNLEKQVAVSGGRSYIPHCIGLAFCLAILVGCMLLWLWPSQPGYDPAPNPKPGFDDIQQHDCYTGFHDWENEWSEERQDYCCKRYGRGCVEHPAQAEVIYHKVPVQVHEPSRIVQAHMWAAEKRSWCCSNFQKGCPHTTLSALKCDAMCEHAGESSKCVDRIHWTKKNVFGSKANGCELAYSKVQEAGCEVHAAGKDPFDCEAALSNFFRAPDHQEVRWRWCWWRCRRKLSLFQLAFLGRQLPFRRRLPFRWQLYHPRDPPLPLRLPGQLGEVKLV